MTIDVIVDAEVVSTLDQAAAERLDKRIRLLVGTINDTIAKLHDLVQEAKHGDAHVALGFPSWTAYLADVFTVDVRLERGARAELVGYLSGEGMSNRTIAEVIGVSRETVNRDVSARDTNVSPEQAPPVTGKDGKTYQRKPKPIVGEPAEFDEADELAPGLTGRQLNSINRKASEPPSPPTLSRPRRKPLKDVARDLSVALMRTNNRLAKLADDDRFSSNKETIGCFMRREVAQGLEILGRIDTGINGDSVKHADEQQPYVRAVDEFGLAVDRFVEATIGWGPERHPLSAGDAVAVHRELLRLRSVADMLLGEPNSA